MKKHHHVEPDTSFMQRTGAGVRKHFIGGVVALILSTITGTVIPLAEEWHSDSMVTQEIDASEARLQKQIDDNRRQEQADTAALWQHRQPTTKEP